MVTTLGTCKTPHQNIRVHAWQDYCGAVKLPDPFGWGSFFYAPFLFPSSTGASLPIPGEPDFQLTFFCPSSPPSAPLLSPGGSPSHPAPPLFFLPAAPIPAFRGPDPTGNSTFILLLHGGPYDVL